MGRYAGINVQFQASLALYTRINYKVLRKPTVKQKEFSAEAQEKGSSKLVLKDWAGTPESRVSGPAGAHDGKEGQGPRGARKRVSSVSYDRHSA